MTKDFKYSPLLFLAILLLIPIGFSRYFVAIYNSVSQDIIIHIHFVVMLVWCLLLLLQPVLIINKKHLWHKRIGKFSYVFMPIIVVVMFLTIGLPTATEAVNEIAKYLFMPFAHMLIFALFYTLAILNKSNRSIHLRCIIISSMSLLGPTIGRMDLGFLSNTPGGFELLIIDLILFSFLLIDKLKKRNIQAFLWGFNSYLAVHIGSITIADSKFWERIVVFLYY